MNVFIPRVQNIFFRYAYSIRFSAGNTVAPLGLVWCHPGRQLTVSCHPYFSHHRLLSDEQTIELDLQQHNLGLNSAWKRAQDRSKWRKLMGMAMSCQGRATR